MQVRSMKVVGLAFALALAAACTPQDEPTAVPSPTATTAPTATPAATSTPAPAATPAGGLSAEMAYLPYYDLAMTLLLTDPKLFTSKLDDSYARAAAGLAANQTRQVSCLAGDGQKQKITAAQCNALPDRSSKRHRRTPALASALTSLLRRRRR